MSYKWVKERHPLYHLKEQIADNLGLENEYSREKVRIGVRKSSDIIEVNLSNLNLKSLPPEALDPVKSYKVNLSLGNNKLTSFSPDLFQGFEHLNKLAISDRIEALPDGIFANLSKLQNLSLRNLELSTFPNNLFADLRNLWRLDIVNMENISSLSHPLFSKLTNLERLRIVENSNLTSLGSKLFYPLSNLKHLALYENKLSTFHPDQFKGLRNLQQMLIYNGKFTKLHSRQFADCSSLVEIRAYRNPLTNLSPKTLVGSKLEELNFEKAEISSIPPDFYFPPTIERLRLSWTPLTELSAKPFLNCPNLELISLREVPEPVINSFLREILEIQQENEDFLSETKIDTELYIFDGYALKGKQIKGLFN